MSLPLTANCDLLQFAFALSKIKRTLLAFESALDRMIDAAIE
jgi:hypothetical protein